MSIFDAFGCYSQDAIGLRMTGLLAVEAEGSALILATLATAPPTSLTLTQDCSTHSR